jgi:hypothetical protein
MTGDEAIALYGDPAERDRMPRALAGKTVAEERCSGQ